MINKNCGIYKITSPTGKVYIGQSVDLKRRFSEYKGVHTCRFQPVIYRSLLKYGFEAHQFDIIEYCTEEEIKSIKLPYFEWSDDNENRLGYKFDKLGDIYFEKKKN